MPPKKKGSKKAQDDWEAELGETIAPANGATESNDALAEDDGEDGNTAGGLMAMLRKNKDKRKKKGIVDNDVVEGEDELGAEPAEDLTAKAPQEATLDDEFALPDKKGKGGKGTGKAAAKRDEPDVDDEAGTGKILTKAEKEKLKKEREKQRKKEQVRAPLIPFKEEAID